MNAPTRVLLIGLDSADRNVLLPWCRSGDMPNLQRLQEDGATGMLTSERGMGDDATNSFQGDRQW